MTAKGGKMLHPAAADGAGHSPKRSSPVERIPDIIQFYARRTTSLEVLLNFMAFEISAETASRICKKLKVRASPDSILRLIRKTDVHLEQGVRVLGVDDWATRNVYSSHFATCSKAAN